MRKLAPVTILITLSPMLPTGGAAVIAASQCMIPPSGKIQAESLPNPVAVADCPIIGRTIMDRDIGAVVPPKGLAVGAEAMLAAGGTSRFTIATSKTGVVTFGDVGMDGAGDVSILVAPAACDDGFFIKEGHDENDLFEWMFNRDTTPTTQVTKDNAQTHLRSGVTNITHQNNDCGLADQVSATSNFVGDTNDVSDINTDSTCNAQDFNNVVDFGNLANGHLGFSCWSYTPIPFADDDLLNGDFRLNKTDFDWTVTPGSCSGRYDVQAVATHEFGHLFGLDDVGEASHGNLTMSPGEICSGSQRTLGRGDVLGFRAVY